MGIIGILVFIVIIIILIGVSGGFITKAATEFPAVLDANVKEAKKFLVIASVVIWISLVIVIVALIFIIPEGVEFFGGFLGKTFVFICFAVLAAGGGLAIASAYYMHKGKLTGLILRNTLIGGGIAAGSAFIIFIGFIVTLFKKKKA